MLGKKDALPGFAQSLGGIFIPVEGKKSIRQRVAEEELMEKVKEGSNDRIRIRFDESMLLEDGTTVYRLYARRSFTLPKGLGHIVQGTRGGWVRDYSIIPGTTQGHFWVGGEAVLLASGLNKECVMLDNAMVFGEGHHFAKTIIRGNAVVGGDSVRMQDCIVEENAVIMGRARFSSSILTGEAVYVPSIHTQIRDFGADSSNPEYFQQVYWATHTAYKEWKIAGAL